MTQAPSTPQPIIIQGAQVLLPSGEIAPRDVAIADGKITALGTALDIPTHTQVIEAQGLTLLPGVIDPQLHFRQRPGVASKEDVFTASCACAKGGVTSFLEIPNTLKPTTTQAVLTDKLAIAAAHSLVNYGFFMGATPENPPDLHEANPACGIAVFMGADYGALSVATAETIEPIFAVGAGGASTAQHRLIAIHAENQAHITAHREHVSAETAPATQTPVQGQEPLQGQEAALLAIKMALGLSKQYQRRLHILNLATGEAAEMLRKDKPSWVTTAITPQNLLLDMAASQQVGPLIQTDVQTDATLQHSIQPPLQPPLSGTALPRKEHKILWQALLDGVIDVIAASHTPHAPTGQSTDAHASSSLPDVETALPLMLTQAKEHRCSVAQVSYWMSTAVAQAYNIPNKGLIEPGFDADLVLVDLSTYRPVLREELHTQHSWSPFEGWNLTGWPVVTMVGGQVVYDHGHINSAVRGQALRFDYA